MPFFDIFASPRWSPLRMRTKVASFFIFFQELSNKKKIKALRPKMTKIASRGGGPALRGAWRDRDLDDIFAHCSFIFYFLDFEYSNFVCLSELHPFIWFFFKNSFRKKKNIRKTTQNALDPSIFIVLSIVLKLGTPLLHTQAQNKLLQNF